LSEFNPTGITPRGPFILVQFVVEAEKKVGLLTVPAGDNEYVEAKVLAVGPGMVAAGGGRSETHDLRAGQTVLMQHKKVVRQQGVVRGEQTYTIPVKSRNKDIKNLYLVPETSIVLIQDETANTEETTNGED
jgi:co-chaperonin GroES (HSP10)